MPRWSIGRNWRGIDDDNGWIFSLERTFSFFAAVNVGHPVNENFYPPRRESRHEQKASNALDYR